MLSDKQVQKLELASLNQDAKQTDIESQSESPMQAKVQDIQKVAQTQNNKKQYEEFVDQVVESTPQHQELENINVEQLQETVENTSLMDSARRNFMRKLLLTSFMCAASMYVRPFLEFQLDQIILLFVALGSVIFTQIYVCASRTAARRVPLNYILLLGFTVGWAYLISFFCSGYSVNPDGTTNERGQTIIFLSVITTFAIVFSLCFFAVTTSMDFTIGGTSCSILGSSLAILSMLIIIGFPVVYILYSLLSGVTFGFYLVFDLQTIMDGKYTDITLDDYILASMLVYTDIVMLFIRTVEIISRILPRD